jgi:predicted nucleotidyltransferase
MRDVMRQRNLSQGSVMVEELVAVTRTIHAERFPDSQVIFLAGSIVRGEGTSTSDLDLVVIYRNLPHARRESFRFGKWPVEAFIHDPETLNHFFLEVDRPSGVPSLPTMICEGIEIPRGSDFSQSIRGLAEAVLSKGPPLWAQPETDSSRYAITNLADDLREPRSRAEQVATATALFGVLANHYLRSRGMWSAKDKSIPRVLHKANRPLAEHFDAAFGRLFQHGDSGAVLALVEEILAPSGGPLFDGYTLQAPAAWRSPT